LNGTDDPGCQGTDGVLYAYQKALNGTKLAGPTYFCKFFEKVRSEIVENLTRNGLEGNLVFSVAIIITDGNIHDMDETRSLLVEMSRMPFSVVVVGIGEGDFENMKILDADEQVLTSKDGKKAVRDIL
jgi:hypothetical protein